MLVFNFHSLRNVITASYMEILILREFWDYKNGNSTYIQSAISKTAWEFLFRVVGVNNNVHILNGI